MPTLADQGWRSAGTHDGVTIATRDVDGPVHEIRATVHAPTPPAAILATLWRHEEYPQFVPYLKRLDVLRDEGNTKLLYEQFSVPVLKDRDRVVRVSRTVDKATGTCDLTSVAVSDEGPPPVRDHVRVTRSTAIWHLVPAAAGGTDVTYTVRTDGGGVVPGWIVNSAQKDAVPKLVRAMLDRAAATPR